MFQAAHITLIQLYPFPEPVFAPEQLAAVGLWPRILGRKSQRDQRHLTLFHRRDTLRSWLRDGRPVIVPNLGPMKALRRPLLPTDRFYRPFFQNNEALDQKLRAKDGPLPFFPIQVLPNARNAEISLGRESRTMLQIHLGQALRTWSLHPMLVLYPAGCLSAQLRLYLETEEPLAAARVTEFLKGWEELPWRVAYKQAGAPQHGQGMATLLDELAGRLRQELLSSQRTLHPNLQETFTLVNLQGSLHNDTTKMRHKQAQFWLTQVAGVPYTDVEAATLWGSRNDEISPWLISGRKRAALAVDDAVRHHQQRRTGACLLEGRRALRNRAISTIEMALATRVLYRLYAEHIEQEKRYWALEPLQSWSQRVCSWFDEPALAARIYGTLLYELAMVPDNLRKADPYNVTLWLDLYDHVLNQRDGKQAEKRTRQESEAATVAFGELVEHLCAEATNLRTALSERREQQFEHFATVAELLLQMPALLAIGGTASSP